MSLILDKHSFSRTTVSLSSPLKGREEEEEKKAMFKPRSHLNPKARLIPEEEPGPRAGVWAGGPRAGVWAGGRGRGEAGAELRRHRGSALVRSWASASEWKSKVSLGRRGAIVGDAALAERALD